ncbi:hypothetical protein [Bacillus safensis]|uniref:hypothetical protein n=1 Tax=Bacillus safensis TaxID=561879 RepID=UPI000462776E|nr:hypothetical protein [Bacillus safensis]PNU21963.1 hypothetical protein C1954_18275 [Bacillus stratosphericus]
MSKKKKYEINNKRKNMKIKKLDSEIYSKKLKELEDVIYTYRDKDLLAYFIKEFIYGHKKEHYKKSIATLYDLDIECLEFAIVRFSHIDNSLDPNRRNLMAILPLFLAFLTTTFNLIEEKWFGFVYVTVSSLVVMWFLNKDRKDRVVTGYMLKTFEQIKVRKEKEDQ